MSKRREGREAAVQYLYQLDIHGDMRMDLRVDFWKLRESIVKVRQFAEALVQGVLKHQEEVDAMIQKYAQNFALGRLNTVDRNILRVAIYEMFHCLETPPIVAINEAIELGKRFGGEDSGRYVNGLLDNVKKELTRPLREATKPRAQTT
jgi:transcription antitermination protein NusB